MDFSVRNKYIKKFMSNYSTNNGLKLIKYLTIIGIDSVRKLHKPPITYETIQKLASTWPHRSIAYTFIRVNILTGITEGRKEP